MLKNPYTVINLSLFSSTPLQNTSLIQQPAETENNTLLLDPATVWAIAIGSNAEQHYDTQRPLLYDTVVSKLVNAEIYGFTDNTRRANAVISCSKNRLLSGKTTQSSNRA